MCNECKKEIKYLKELLGVDGEDFLESHGFSTVFQALSYLLTKVDQPNARLGAVRPKDGYFERVDAVAHSSIPGPTINDLEREIGRVPTVAELFHHLRKDNPTPHADLPSQEAA